MADVTKLVKALRQKTKYELAHETAQKNAVDMLGLPPDNTAMDRARALGFDTSAYHGTNADFNAFDLSRTGTASGAEQYGTGVYTASNPATASGYADVRKEGANVLPLMVKMKSPLSPELEKQLTKTQVRTLLSKSPELDDALWNFGDVSHEGKFRVFNDAVNQVHEYQRDKLLDNLHPIANDFYSHNPQKFNDVVSKVIKKDGVQVEFPTGDKFYVPFNPNQVRSRFAAFDPARVNEADLLGYATPAMMGTLATATGAGVIGANKAKNKQLAEAVKKGNTLKAPDRNKVLGMLADALKPVRDYASTVNVPILNESLADLTGLSGTQSLADDMSYGKPLFSGGSVQTSQIDPRVLDVANFAPMALGTVKPLAKMLKVK